MEDKELEADGSDAGVIHMRVCQVDVWGKSHKMVAK